MGKSWQDLETYVRNLAELRWKKICSPKNISGVNFDGVVEVSSEEVVLIEITKEKNLNKIRNDINKINMSRMQYLSNGILNNIVTIKIYINSELKGLPEIENLSIVYDCEHLAFMPEIDYEEKYFKIFRIKEEAIKDVKSFLVKTIEKYNEKQLNKLKNAFDIIAERAEFMSNIIVTSIK